MKKTILIFVCSLLFLSSCTKTKSPVDPNVFYLESLPEIGEFSVNSKEEYFSPLVSDEFVPSREYGEIIPYVGSYRVFETPESEDWHTEMGYCSFGFCTPDGRIVMKASDKNSHISVRETDDGFVFYTISRETVPKDDAPDEFLFGETVIVPRDGSWCVSLKSNSWVSNAGGGYIAVCDYPEDGLVRTLLYDYEGKLVRIVEGVDSVGVYSHGLIRTAEWTDESGYQTQFIDDEDDVVFGPYKNASDFNDYGIAIAEDDRGAYLMNRDGDILTDFYESIFVEQTVDEKTKVFSARHKENEKVDVFDETGNHIGTVDGTTYFSLRGPENGELYYYYTEYDMNDKGYPIYDTERLVYKRVSDASDFVSKEFGLLPNSYMGSDNCYIHIDKKNQKGYFFDGNGETIAFIDEISDVNCVSEYGEYIVYTTGEYKYQYDYETSVDNSTDTRKTHIYDSKKKKVIYTLDMYASAYFPDSNGRFVLLTVSDSEDFFGGTTSNCLFDTKTGEILFEDSEHISVYTFDDEMYVCVCTENMSAVYDKDLNVIRRTYFE